MKKGKARPDNFTKAQDSAAPGQYESTKNFGQDLKKITLGRKTVTKITESAGPGQYDVDRSVSATKHRVSSAVFSKTAARPSSFAN